MYKIYEARENITFKDVRTNQPVTLGVGDVLYGYGRTRTPQLLITKDGGCVHPGLKGVVAIGSTTVYRKELIEAIAKMMPRGAILCNNAAMVLSGKIEFADSIEAIFPFKLTNRFCKRNYIYNRNGHHQKDKAPVMKWQDVTCKELDQDKITTYHMKYVSRVLCLID